MTSISSLLKQVIAEAGFPTLSFSRYTKERLNELLYILQRAKFHLPKQEFVCYAIRMGIEQDKVQDRFFAATFQTKINAVASGNVRIFLRESSDTFFTIIYKSTTLIDIDQLMLKYRQAWLDKMIQDVEELIAKKEKNNV